MGLEIAGTVVAMGPEVQGFALGDRVMGIVGGGAYAELTRIDHRMAMPVPAGMDLVAAGAVAEVFVTARVRHGQGRQAWRRAGLRGRCVHRLPQRRLSGGGGAGHAGPGRGCGDRLHRGSVPAAQRAVAGRRGAPGVGGAAGGAQGAELPMDVVLYRHLQIFGTVMKSRPPEVKQAMVQRFAQQWLPALANRGDPAGDRQHVCTGRCCTGPSAHGVWRQHRQDSVAAKRELSCLRPAPHLCGTGLPGPSAWPRFGPPQPAAAGLRHAANMSSSVLYASVFTSIRPSTEWK